MSHRTAASNFAELRGEQQFLFRQSNLITALWIIDLQEFNVMTPCQSCRQCLQNWISQVHFPHFIDIAQAKSAAVTNRKILRQLI